MMSVIFIRTSIPSSTTFFISIMFIRIRNSWSWKSPKFLWTFSLLHFFFSWLLIKTPPWTLPIPPCKRWTACLPLLVFVRVSGCQWFFSCFLMRSLQGRQCVLEIRSMPQWHSIRTLLIWMKPPFLLKMEVFLLCQMASVIFIRKNIPSSTKIFVSMIFNYSNMEQIGRGFLGTVSFCISSLTDYPDNLCLLPFLPYLCQWSLPFLMTYSGNERKTIVYSTNFRLTAVSFCKKCPHVQ